MKTLIIDAQIAGASGDMFLGALFDLLFPEIKNKKEADKNRQEMLTKLTRQIVDAIELEEVAINTKLQRKNNNAMEGLGLEIAIKEPHRHLHMAEALDLVTLLAKNLSLSEKATNFSRRAFEILFEAEAEAHGESLSAVHLHEAGSLDTFLDILVSAVILDQLQLFETSVYLLPVAVGSGTVTFSHGTLPVPAPAVKAIIEKYQLPVKIGHLDGELLTPTGAIIIVALLEATNHRLVPYPPSVVIKNTGIGFGTKEFSKSPNALRLFLTESISLAIQQEEIATIETNIDDCSGEVIGHITNRLLSLGARDVFLTPIYMKKGRPGTKISVLCPPEEQGKFISILLEETSTLGVRIVYSSKLMLNRKIKPVQFAIKDKTWTIDFKIAYDEMENIIQYKPEFEALRIIAQETGLPLAEIRDKAIEIFRNQFL
jgi:hypothetical protein